MVTRNVGIPGVFLSPKTQGYTLFWVLWAMFLLNACSVDPAVQLNRIESRLTTMAELRSYEYIYREILYFGEQERFLGFIPTKNRQFLFSVNLHVSAGVDLTQARVRLDSQDNPELLLPEPRILSIDAQEDSLRQYFSQDLGGGLQLLELSDLLDQAKESIQADAVSRGILNQARAEAQDILSGLGRSLGFEHIQITWLKPENSESAEQPHE